MASGQSKLRTSGKCLAKKKRCSIHVYVGSWNMRTLVEAEGPIETSVARPGGRGVTVDRKATLMVREFKKYGVQLAGISETKWCGESTYHVDGYTILHSGRPVPDESPMRRSEGVGVVMDPKMTTAWKEAGEVWKAVSSRIICARLKMCSYEVNTTHKKRRRKIPAFVTLVSYIYASTFRVSAEEKEKVFADLQVTLDVVD